MMKKELLSSEDDYVSIFIINFQELQQFNSLDHSKRCWRTTFYTFTHFSLVGGMKDFLL